MLLSLLHTLWREMKSKRDYIVPPSTTLTPKIPEDALKGAPGCMRGLACVNFDDLIKMVSARFLGEGNGTPLQYYCLENPMDGGAW